MAASDCPLSTVRAPSLPCARAAAVGLRAGIPADQVLSLSPLPLQAFQPLLRQVMYGRGDALFLGLALQPREAAAQGRSGLVLLGDRAELAQRLGVTRLPCTLLLRGDRLLARLEFATGAAAQPAAVAAAAVRQLEAALDDQGLGRGVPNGVSPHPGAMPEAPAPAPAGRN